MRRRSTTLTEQELEIMKIVWERDRSTVRDVYETLLERRKVAYTTVMTMMKILEQKKYLKKTMADRAYVYRPAQPKGQVIGDMVRDFIDRVFNGSAEPLLLHRRRHTKIVYCDRGARPSPLGMRPAKRRLDIPVGSIDIDRHRSRAPGQNGIRQRHARISRHQHRVTRPNPQRPKRQPQRRQPGGHAHRMPHAAHPRQRRLQLLYPRPLRPLPAANGPHHGVALGFSKGQTIVWN